MPTDFVRFGLCCSFRDEPIRFARALATPTLRLGREEALAKLSALVAANVVSLRKALEYCVEHRIGCFRINSQFLPVQTHPVVGYDVADLPGGDALIRGLQECGEFARSHQIRTCFHPDQFVVLNSQRSEVVEASLREIECQAQLADWVNADVVNIHAGGAFGDKVSALKQLSVGVNRLSDRARRKLTIENDDRTFNPADLLPWCAAEKIPLVYDVHHHRCHPDGTSVEQATELAIKTWDREPMFHLSSPLEGWSGPGPQRHSDFIDVKDFPACWLGQKLTVEVEAKAKELAVLQLMRDLERVGRRRPRAGKPADPKPRMT